MKPSFPLLGVLLGAALFQFPREARAQDLYRTYRNARYGTTLRYPANLVEPQPESQSGDGRKFVSRDGQIELTVYARRNISARSAGSEMRRAITDWKADGARLTYYRAVGSWFALSGYLGDDIFYEKTLLRNGIFHTLIWQYPKALKKRLDAGVARSVASFSAGKGCGTAKSPANLQAQPAPQPRTTATPPPRIVPRETPSIAPRGGY